MNPSATASIPKGDMMTGLNVLMITTHDINPHLGSYAGVWPGADEAFTPNLDKLAAEGIRFDNAYATTPVCAPSRSAMMTGCYPTTIGTMHMRTRAVPPPEVRLLPYLFREAGYYTTNRFFTDYQVDVPALVFDDISPVAHWRGRPEGVPFFAQFHGMTTHESQIYLDDEAFAKATSAVPDDQRHDPAQVTIPPYYPDTEVFARSWARYLDLITQMDVEVGEILRQLDEDGLTDSTLVVFVSDHGVGMPRAKRWASEAGLREPLIMRLPGVIEAGSSEERVVSLIDLAPTMLAACGLAMPEWMQGVSLLGDRAAKLESRRYVFGGRDRMDEQEDTSRTVRDERFRYIRNLHPDRSGMQHHEYADRLATWAEFRELLFEEAQQIAVGLPADRLTPLQRSIVAADKPEHELYDLLVDPHEQTNLAEEPAFAADRARLSSALKEWQSTLGDLGLTPEHELIESWRPGGKRQQTSEPVVEIVDGRAIAHCDTDGALIGWLPAAESAPPEGDAVLSEQQPWMTMLGLDEDSRAWRIFGSPLDMTEDILVKAWRLGFTPSNEVRVALQPGSHRYASAVHSSA